MDGHIPRNMRVALNMIDIAAPYINLYVEHDTKASTQLEWKLGGTVTVDDTRLYVRDVDCKTPLRDLQTIFGDYLDKEDKTHIKIDKN